MQQATEKAERRLIFAHNIYRRHTKTTNKSITLWRENESTCSMDQAVVDLFSYFKEKCSNNLAQVPFIKASELLCVGRYDGDETTIMRDYIINKVPWTLNYVSTTFPQFFKFISGIEKLVQNNFDLELGETLRPNCGNICLQYLEFVEKYLESRELKIEKHCPIYNNDTLISEHLKPFLFCPKMNFLIVNLDECEFECTKEEYLRFLLITQCNVALLNSKTFSMSYFFSGNSISVFFSHFYDRTQHFNFHRTFNLENVQDLLDLALEFYQYQNMSAQDYEVSVRFRPSTYEYWKGVELRCCSKITKELFRKGSKKSVETIPQHRKIHKKDRMVDKLRKI